MERCNGKKLRWWGELVGERTEKRPEGLVFPGKTNKSDDLITWFISWILPHYATIWFFMHGRPGSGPHLLIWDGPYRRFFINLLTPHRAVLQSFNRDDFFQIYWFSRLPRDQWVRRWICDSDEIRPKWQRRTEMSWSEEKTPVTNGDLGPQMNLGESGDENQ